MTWSRLRWFKAAVAAGFLLGILLAVSTVYTFRYVVRHLVLDHVAVRAGQVVSGLESVARAENAPDAGALAATIEAFRQEHGQEVAWIRIADQQGHVLAATVGAGHERLPDARVEVIVTGRAQQVAEPRATPLGDALVVTLPFRYQFPEERVARPVPEAGKGQPRFKIAEATLYVEGAAGVFWPLRRALLISLAAAVALLGAMTVLVLQFRRYEQAREIEQQLAVARQVQRELLPRECPGCAGLDFAVEFLPVFDVGGDFYDIFRVPNGDVAFVLGDVSGKGLPAALLMGVTHGAIRAASARWTRANLADLASQLNELLLERTSGNRYVTLFWGFVDGEGRTIRYVNAGHPPPLLLRPGPDGGLEVERLDAGGTVVGLLPKAPYAAGEAILSDGDLLIAFSDGLTEAANAADEEFGSDGVIAAVGGCTNRLPHGVLAAILEAARGLASGRPFRDDLTLLVVRAGPAPPRE
jgi:serine phosphatase RsbU (regulator of sigma subunit)